MTNIKVLLTGATGLLGEHLIKNCPQEYLISGTYHQIKPRLKAKNVDYYQLDITNFKQINGLVTRIKPEVILHTASIGNVDYCEKNRAQAKKINVEGTNCLFFQSRKFRSLFVFFSSNAIFDGNKPPYHELSKPKPLDYYGLTKLVVEKRLEEYQNQKEVLIVRLMTMFGWNNPSERQNPVTWFIEKLKKEEEFPVVNDIFNNYLYAKDAVWAIWRLIEIGAFGKYNLAGKETISRFELAQKTALAFNLRKNLIKSVPSTFFKSLAPRPKNTTFDIKKVFLKIKFQPKLINEALTDMRKAQIYEKNIYC